MFQVDAEKIGIDVQKQIQGQGNYKAKNFAMNYKVFSAIQQMGYSKIIADTLSDLLDLPLLYSMVYRVL